MNHYILQLSATNMWTRELMSWFWTRTKMISIKPVIYDSADAIGSFVELADPRLPEWDIVLLRNLTGTFLHVQQHTLLCIITEKRFEEKQDIGYFMVRCLVIAQYWITVVSISYA